MTMTADDIMEQVRALPERERLRLVERIVHEVVEQKPAAAAKPPLADMSDEEFQQFQDVIQHARATQPLRTPR
jgi:hypothetical protein